MQAIGAPVRRVDPAMAAVPTSKRRDHNAGKFDTMMTRTGLRARGQRRPGALRPARALPRRAASTAVSRQLAFRNRVSFNWNQSVKSRFTARPAGVVAVGSMEKFAVFPFVQVSM